MGMHKLHLYLSEILSVVSDRLSLLWKVILFDFISAMADVVYARDVKHYKTPCSILEDYIVSKKDIHSGLRTDFWVQMMKVGETL